ncbi:MAG: MATE family efflux transporter [Planctomycetaceae bacterium]
MDVSIASSTDPEDVPGSLRELLTIAIPLVISSGSLSLMHVVDRVMLTWHSPAALAASTPGGMLHWTLMSLPFGMVAYVNTFVAQYDGAQRRDRVAAAVWQGVWMAILSGLILALATPWTCQLTALFGHAPDVQSLESQYFSVLSVGSLPALTSSALSAFFSGRGRTVVLMVVNAVTAVANGLFNWLLIFGWGNWAGLGIQGAAWGTIIAQLLGTLLYLFWMRREGRRHDYPFAAERRTDRALLLRMLRYGFPNGTQYVIDVGAYLLLLVFIGRIGSRELAATNLAFNLNSLAFIPLFGIGTAVSTLVGRRIGEGRSHLAIRSTWLAFGLAAAYMGLWALIYLLGQDQILAPFAMYSDPVAFAELRPVVQKLLIYVVLYSLFDAMAVIFGAAIRGAGDTRFSLFYTAAVLWSCMVLPTWWIARSGLGLFACWNVLILQFFILGTGFLLRFRQGRWLEMHVIEPVPAGLTLPAVVEEPSTAVVFGSVGDATALEENSR